MWGSAENNLHIFKSGQKCLIEKFIETWKAASKGIKCIFCFLPC
jgi:hypothetical protein